MTNPQGTAWESEIETDTGGLRLVKRGQKDEADVVIYGNTEDWTIPALFWKRIVKRGGKVRQPLGERKVVVLRYHDFLEMLEVMQDRDRSPCYPTVYVQAKWAEQISVTKVLGGLSTWLAAKLDS